MRELRTYRPWARFFMQRGSIASRHVGVHVGLVNHEKDSRPASSREAGQHPSRSGASRLWLRLSLRRTACRSIALGLTDFTNDDLEVMEGALERLLGDCIASFDV